MTSNEASHKRKKRMKKVRLNQVVELLDKDLKRTGNDYASLHLGENISRGLLINIKKLYSRYVLILTDENYLEVWNPTHPLLSNYSQELTWERIENEINLGRG